MKPMRIAFVITGLSMGGAENQVITLADRLASLGNVVIVISMTGEQLVHSQHKDVRVESLYMARDPISFLRAYLRARALLRAFSPDVVHSHMVHANLFARLLRMTTPMGRLICTAHNSNEGGAVRMLAYRLTDPLADISTNVSDEAVQAFIRRGAVRSGRMITMYNGIDCARFRFSPEDRERLRGELGAGGDTQVLLAVGRFTEQKDYGNLLRAFARVCAACTDCVLWIVGTGDARTSLESTARTLGVAGRVRFLGLRHDVPSLMSAADIYVLSSAWEGMPLVIGEAMACERVVVATDAGGIREWLGDAGFVVPVRDSEALARGLHAALTLSSEEKRARGTAARRRVACWFSLDAAVARWLQVYRGPIFRPDRLPGKPVMDTNLEQGNE
ncbi:MAG TPA: glycosyltransferase [Noviherbaspirillum sp.]|uniref:glycosyltransferase n=1 Tax=Noviherbaspirillum sp. TaxID=1926288 RepID=UPI002D6CCED4|nr:glycosyltransferase [Noviherbaspirillum sp.]HYD97131.1 glycosyltransferase [Noviherbaspirillum sp.]